MLLACGASTAGAQTRDRARAFAWAVPAGGSGSDDDDGIGPRPGGGVVIFGGLAGTSRFGTAGALWLSFAFATVSLIAMVLLAQRGRAVR